MFSVCSQSQIGRQKRVLLLSSRLMTRPGSHFFFSYPAVLELVKLQMLQSVGDVYGILCLAPSFPRTPALPPTFLGGLCKGVPPCKSWQARAPHCRHQCRGLSANMMASHHLWSRSPLRSMAANHGEMSHAVRAAWRCHYPWRDRDKMYASCCVNQRDWSTVRVVYDSHRP